MLGRCAIRYAWLLALLLGFSGCGGGGGGGSVSGPPPTVTVKTVAGTASVTVTANAGAHVLVNYSGSSRASVALPIGTLSQDTTYSFAPLTPGSGGVPLLPTGYSSGSMVRVTSNPPLPAGKTVTLDFNPPSGMLSGQKADLFKVVTNEWTDTGSNGTVKADGMADVELSGFSDLAYFVINFTGNWIFSGSITASNNPDQCGATVGDLVADTSMTVTQDLLSSSLSTVTDGNIYGGNALADRKFTATFSYADPMDICTYNYSAVMSGTINPLSSPWTFSGTDVWTIVTSGESCTFSSCSYTRTITGTKQ